MFPLISASTLYDYLECPHKVWRDVYGPKEEMAEEDNAFLKLLWERGVKHEEQIISKLGDYLNIDEVPVVKRFEKTIESMKNEVPLIYHGVLKFEEYMGIPDILKRMPDGSYMPIDIKSGMAFEGGWEENIKEGKYKKHYAVQLCLYNELLKKLGFASHDYGMIIDGHGKEVIYDLNSFKGKRDKLRWLDFYDRIKTQVFSLIHNRFQNKPALSGACKLCNWRESCKNWCEKNRDLSLIFYIGKNVRDKINEDLLINTLDEFMEINIDAVMKEKTKCVKEKIKSKFLYHIGKSSLEDFLRRAKVINIFKKPVAYKKIVFPKVNYELFFDIEDDPTQEFVYLHGVYERNGNSRRFLDFTAKELTKEAEKSAWKGFWDYINSLPENDFAVYYYSHHEKTTYLKLQKIYPDVVSEESVSSFFGNPNVIDLYNYVKYSTDWPLSSYSIKPIANYLGFNWRDESPSGALSIQWFNEYLETKDEKILKRILEYNEDDCKAMMVLKDEMEKLEMISSF